MPTPTPPAAPHFLERAAHWLAALSLVLTGCATTLPARIPAGSDGHRDPSAYAASTFEGEGGVLLFEESWHPAAAPRAVVVIVHGLKDYGHRYAALASELVGKGFAVYAFDQRGHGHSAGARAYVEHFDEYEKDLSRFIDRVAAREPGRPIFLVGHSMGGAIATLYTLDHGDRLAGLVLSAPALARNPDVSGAAIGFTKFLSAIAPSLRVLSLDDDRFSRDPAVAVAMRSDPLVDDASIPARTAAGLIDAFATIHARASSLKLPLLVMEGTVDRITPVAGSRALVDAASSSDKNLVLFEGAFHDLAHETNAAEVRARITGWLSTHIHE